MHSLPLTTSLYISASIKTSFHTGFAAPYVAEHGQLLLLLDRFLYGLQQSPLKFQLHLSRTLVDAGYKQHPSMTNAYLTKTRDQSSVTYQLTLMAYSTVSITLLWPTSSKIK